MPKKTSPASDALETYREKRDFQQTPEPAPKKSKTKRKEPLFVVQMHDATRLHWDFRLEIDGVLKSWAVPKGPSGNPRDKRLAVLTEDHPLEYAGFEGVIPEGNYGAGPVLLWDLGTYTNDSARHGQERTMAEAFAQGHILIWLNGQKLKGGYALIHSAMGGEQKNWLLIKESKDAEMDPKEDLVKTRPESVLSGKKIDELQPEKD